jgi:RNA polymerase sigma-70 factor, ECF subfamily
MSAASLTFSPYSLTMPDSDSTANSPALPIGVDAEDAESIRLMLLVKEGNERAFEQLVSLHQNAVIGTATRMLGSVEDGHDVAQQLFVRIWKSAPRYEPTAKFTTWMFTILRNLVFNELRKRVRRKEVSLDEPINEDQTRDLPDLSTVPADVSLERQELEAALDRAIAALPEKSRLAVVLRRYEETPYDELCSILGMTLPAVKSLLFRARTELRKQLSQFLGEDTE